MDYDSKINDIVRFEFGDKVYIRFPYIYMVDPPDDLLGTKYLAWKVINIDRSRGIVTLQVMEE